jgi:hypothetical protein
MHNEIALSTSASDRDNLEKPTDQYDEEGGTGTAIADPKLQRRVLLKQDLTILPILAICYFFSYVDRGQIGNARILGLQKDLGLSPDQYYNTLLVFFIGYAVIELPCCLALLYIRPSLHFGVATVIFGMLATLIAAVHSYGALIAIRFLLGLSEAFVQAAFIFVSLWYQRDELALRVAIFWNATPLAGAVSGLIAYGVGKNLHDAQGIASWRWLFMWVSSHFVDSYCGSELSGGWC